MDYLCAQQKLRGAGFTVAVPTSPEQAALLQLSLIHIFGCTTSANTFLNTRTLFIIVLGLSAFAFGTAAGVLFGKLMYVLRCL